jgi:glycosyltransferase involved in cell wall biosynthesis
MRVFYDHQVTSLQDAGGISRYYFELVRSLSHTGQVNAEVLLGLTRSVVPFATLRPAARVQAFPGMLPAGYKRYACNETLTAAVAPFLGRFDIYHAGYQRVLPYVRTSAVVATHHDSTPQRFPHLFRNAEAIRQRLATVYQRADRIICISESSRADLLHYFAVAPEKTVVIHHGFTPFPKGQEDLLHRLLPKQPYLLFVGARHSYKNFPAVMEALALQKGSELHLLVAGGGAFIAEEVQAMERLRIADRVHLLPRVSDELLAAAYRHAHIFIYPSLYEGFGFPPLEAMHAGCPVVVSRSSAVPEICGDAAFYFDPTSVEELAALITSLSGDEQLRLSKREAGYAQVRKFAWEHTAAQTLEAYRKALDPRNL